MHSSLVYVIRHLRRQQLRTAAGAIGIFITVALLMAIEIGLDSVSISYTDLVAMQSGRADILITTPDSQWFRAEPFDASLAESSLRQHPEVLGVTGRMLGVVKVAAKGREHSALLLGVDMQAEKKLKLSGLYPEPALDGSACAISRALAKRLGMDTGARIAVRLNPQGDEHELPIRTIIDRQLMLPQEVREFVVVDLEKARVIFGEPLRVHMLAGIFRNPTAYYDARDLRQSVLRLKSAGAALAAALGENYEVRLPKATAIMDFQNVTSPLRAVFGVFAVLTLSVTGLLLYSILSVAVEERVREYGILRTLGARRSEILRLVLSESCLLSLLGVVPGVFAGAGLAWLMVRFAEVVMKVEFGSINLCFSATHFWLTLALGSALSLGSALIPALQATRWQIVDALNPHRRGQVREKQREPGSVNRGQLLTGLALSALSVVVFFVLPAVILSGNNSLIGTVMLGLLLSILLGFTLMGASVLPWIQALVMRIAGLFLGPVAELARRSLHQHQRRNITTAVMFILSVSLVIFAASLMALFSQTSMTLMEHFTGADFRLESNGAAGKDLKTDLQSVKGISQVSEVKFLRSRSQRGIAYDVVLGDLVGMKRLWVVPFGVDSDLPKVLFTNQIRYFEGGREALDQVASYKDNTSPKTEPPILLSLAAALYLDVRVNDLVQFTFHLGAERRTGRFKVAGICSALAGFSHFRGRVANAIGSGVLMPISIFSDFTQQAPEEALMARYFLKAATEESEAHRVLAQELRDRFDLRYQFSVKSVVEQKREATVLYWATQVFFGLLLAIAVTISVFALIASMAGAVLERRWEIGMLKALGLRRHQLFRMFLGEAFGVTASAGLIGGVIGFALAWLFVMEAGTLAEVPITFTMPYVTFAATLVVSLAAAAVAAYLPTREILRKTAAEILRLDT